MADNLTRKYLGSLGLEQDKIDAIIEAHSSTVEALTSARTELEALRKERDSLKQGATDAATEKARADKAEKDLADYKTLVAANEKRGKVETAYRKLAQTARIDEKRLDTVVKWARTEGILDKATLQEDGTLAGADDLTKALTTEWADFVTNDSTKGSNPATPPGGAPVDDDMAAVRAAMGLPPIGGKT